MRVKTFQPYAGVSKCSITSFWLTHLGFAPGEVETQPLSPQVLIIKAHVWLPTGYSSLLQCTLLYFSRSLSFFLDWSRLKQSEFWPKLISINKQQVSLLVWKWPSTHNPPVLFHFYILHFGHKVFQWQSKEGEKNNSLSLSLSSLVIHLFRWAGHRGRKARCSVTLSGQALVSGLWF